MSNKKPIPPYPTVPVEEEIEEDLKTIDETETPLLSGECWYNYIIFTNIIMLFCINLMI